MNLYVRLLLSFLRAVSVRRIKTSDVAVQSFRVWPTDIDLYRHMNNGRYFQIMDVARFSWLVKTGTVKVLAQQGWGALLGGSLMRFRRSLKAFQRYTVATRLICWDDRWYYLEHVFRDHRGRRVATGIVRAAFRSKSGWVSTREAMGIIEPDAISPAMPEEISAWLRTESALCTPSLTGDHQGGANTAAGRDAAVAADACGCRSRWTCDGVIGQTGADQGLAHRPQGHVDAG